VSTRSSSFHPRRRIAIRLTAIAFVALLAACRGSGVGNGDSQSPSASASTATSGSPVASASTEPTAAPSDELGPFACDLPVTGTATTARAQLVKVRVGTHAGYDRVVFEFADGVPGFTLDEATPPLVEDASGRELDVDGNAFWQLVMRDASRTDLDGDEMLTQTDYTPNFPKLTELIEGGDFEAVSTWYFGLEAGSCVRVLTLQHPSRLVFDIQH
jgi:hypothetical protein